MIFMYNPLKVFKSRTEYTLIYSFVPLVYVL